MALSQQQISEIVTRHEKYIWAAIHKRCGDLPFARLQDLHQDITIRLYRALASERKIEYLPSYITRTVMNAVVDMFRQQQRCLQETSESDCFSELEIVPDAEISRPESQALQADKLKQVQLLIAKMADNRRVSILLHLQGYTSSEIGELNGWTEAKARNLVSRAMKALRDQLEQAGITYETD